MPVSTIIVEDGTGVAGANSYASAATVTAYCFDRGYTVPTDDTLSQAIFISMDAFEAMYGSRFNGDPASSTQLLSWPRQFTPPGLTLFSYIYNPPITCTPVAIAFPAIIPRALCRLVVDVAAGNTPLTTTTGQELKLKITGPVTKEWFQAFSDQLVFREVEAMLQPLLVSGRYKLTVMRA